MPPRPGYHFRSTTHAWGIVAPGRVEVHRTGHLAAEQKTATAERPPRPRRLQVDPAPPRNRCRARRPRPDRRAAARRCHHVPAHPGRRPLRPCNGMTVVAEAEIRGHWAGRRDHAGVDRADRSETRAVMAGITETGPTFARPSMPAVQGDRAGSVGQEGSPASQACLSVSSDHYKLPTAPFLREQRRPGGQLRHLGHIHPRRRSRYRPSLT